MLDRVPADGASTARRCAATTRSRWSRRSATGLALGVAAAIGSQVEGGPPWLHLVLRDLSWMGLFWNLANLLPVLPLDGGAKPC